jgi:hypothetical protein
MANAAVDVLNTLEQDLEALATPAVSPAGADITQPGSWAAGQASSTTTLNAISTALNILNSISDGSGIGTTVSNVSGKLASLLQDVSTALTKLADKLVSGLNVSQALQAAISELTPGGNAVKLLTQIQQDAQDLQSLIDAVQADANQTCIDLYKIAQQFTTLATKM